MLWPVLTSKKAQLARPVWLMHLRPGLLAARSEDLRLKNCSRSWSVGYWASWGIENIFLEIFQWWKYQAGSQWNLCLFQMPFQTWDFPCFWVSHKKLSPNIGSEIGKPSENNRSQWLSKNNRTDCDGKKWPKTSTSHRCYEKTIGIASLSKIDHRWSLVEPQYSLPPLPHTKNVHSFVTFCTDYLPEYDFVLRTAAFNSWLTSATSV